MLLPPDLRNLLYLAAAVLFILGIRSLGHPRTAVRGNQLGACGMLLAVVVTLLDQQIVGWGQILAGLAVGGLVGALLAMRVQLTAMPQLVAILNGLGGIASALVAAAALHERRALSQVGDAPQADDLWEALKAAMLQIDPALQLDPPRPSTGIAWFVALAASALVGGVTLTGSVVAWGKLQELRRFNDLGTIGRRLRVGAAISGVCAIGASAWLIAGTGHPAAFWLLLLAALALGIMLVGPIGGADMPVVISLLNAYSGLAAAATGFVIGNLVLVIAGALVGASGIILTRIMCVAMNRSLANVLFGGALGVEATTSRHDEETYGGRIKATSADEVAMLLDDARRVCIVPGYGLAVSQAQHLVRDLVNLLTARGVEVVFGMHPVAGRMPGHMNVLLAEADIPYERLLDLDAANSAMETMDMTIVIGANDVVNPLARTDPTSPIAGMPILDVDRSRTVVVIKRSLSPGFAGVPNPLFAADNCLMLFGDGRKALQELIAAVKG